MVIFLLQRKLQYFPSGKLYPIENYQLDDFTAHKLITSDGIKITAWFKSQKISKKF